MKKRPRDPNQLAKNIVGIATGEVQEIPEKPMSPAAELGRMGGKARAKGLSARKRREIAKKAAKTRWEGH